MEWNVPESVLVDVGNVPEFSGALGDSDFHSQKGWAGSDVLAGEIAGADAGQRGGGWLRVRGGIAVTKVVGDSGSRHEESSN